MKRKDEVGFPRELLKQSKQEREQYFVEYAAEHPALAAAYKKLLRLILDPGGKQLVFVIGPTGVGKTFLMKAVMAEIRDRFSTEQAKDSGRIPIVGIEVPSRDEIRPSYRIIYTRLLIEMEEPLIDKKIVYADVPIQRGTDGLLSINERARTSKLRYALEQALKHRRPYAVFLDEGQHLLEMAGLALQDQMDCLKSIANMTRVLHVLFGTYEMFDLLDLSDQLMRRSSIIHLHRYGKGSKNEETFQSILLTFQKNMPFENEPDLMRHWSFFKDRTAGCVGMLYDWLLAAYKLALYDEEASTLTEKHIEEACDISEERAAKMNSNITNDEGILIKAIGAGETYFAKWAAINGEEAKRNKGEEAKNKQKSRRSKKAGQVGKPKPKRYPNGMNRESGGSNV